MARLLILAFSVIKGPDRLPARVRYDDADWCALPRPARGRPGGCAVPSQARRGPKRRHARVVSPRTPADALCAAPTAGSAQPLRASCCHDGYVDPRGNSERSSASADLRECGPVRSELWPHIAMPLIPCRCRAWSAVDDPALSQQPR